MEAVCLFDRQRVSGPKLASSKSCEPSLNRALCTLCDPFLKRMCFQVLLSIFAVHIEPLQSGNLSKPNHLFGPKGVEFRKVTLCMKLELMQLIQSLWTNLLVAQL